VNNNNNNNGTGGINSNIRGSGIIYDRNLPAGGYYLQLDMLTDRCLKDFEMSSLIEDHGKFSILIQ
jgi:hypothetical protein